MKGDTVGAIEEEIAVVVSCPTLGDGLTDEDIVGVMEGVLVMKVDMLEVISPLTLGD